MDRVDTVSIHSYDSLERQIKLPVTEAGQGWPVVGVGIQALTGIGHKGIFGGSENTPCLACNGGHVGI